MRTESRPDGAIKCEVECLTPGHAHEPSVEHGSLCTPDIGSAWLPDAANNEGKNQIRPMVIRAVSRRGR
jgi:hypothetical protein